MLGSPKRQLRKRKHDTMLSPDTPAHDQTSEELQIALEHGEAVLQTAVAQATYDEKVLIRAQAHHATSQEHLATSVQNVAFRRSQLAHRHNDGVTLPHELLTRCLTYLSKPRHFFATGLVSKLWHLAANDPASHEFLTLPLDFLQAMKTLHFAGCEAFMGPLNLHLRRSFWKPGYFPPTNFDPEQLLPFLGVFPKSSPCVPIAFAPSSLKCFRERAHCVHSSVMTCGKWMG
jgi:hypothetical protein